MFMYSGFRNQAGMFKTNLGSGHNHDVNLYRKIEGEAFWYESLVGHSLKKLVATVKCIICTDS